MLLQKITHKNYTTKSHQEQLVLPFNLGLRIPEDDPVRLLSQQLEELDYHELWQAYSHLGRKPVTDPPTLFRILVYAYSQNIYSSRAIEKACRENIKFIWLLQDEPVPDHNTICKFRSERLEGVLEGLFAQFTKKLQAMGEVDFNTLFVDGTKIEANANKYTFVWKKAVSKNETKLLEKIKELCETVNQTYEKNFEYVESHELELIKEIGDYLETLKAKSDIEFVYGKGKRKTELQRQTEKAIEYQQRLHKYKNYQETFKGRNSFSKTDTDATFMHMKEDHMRNSQLKPGYNLQIGVENQYIISTDVYSERSDQLTLIPFLEGVKETYNETYQEIVADAGYESEENYIYLEENEQMSYIKPANHEQLKSRSFKKKIGRRENMSYDSEGDFFICANEQQLEYVYDSTRTTKSGYKRISKVYESRSCEGCLLKEKCTRAKGNRKLYVSWGFEKRRKQSQENITTERGIKLRMNRSIQVEGAFGVLKEDYGFRRFLTRGTHKVKIEFMLLCFGYNINKLHSRIQKEMLGHKLYKLKEKAS